MDHGILFDHARLSRIGLPEAVFCEGKPEEALRRLLIDFSGDDVRPVLFTRLAQETFQSLPEAVRLRYDYHALSRTAFTRPLPRKAKGRVAIVSAGTSDAAVTWEAARTLGYLGIEHTVFEDCGVAGLWRLLERLDEVNSHDAVIAVAGLDAALVSVLGGLTPRPLFGVPTSVGYGAAQGGHAALASMLSSCSPGIGILNIHNGYGAACAAARIVNAS